MKIASRWADIPKPIRDHMEQRLRTRQITASDLGSLRIWIESEPEVPEGEWFKDFRTFILCGEGRYPKTLLSGDMRPYGTEVF